MLKSQEALLVTSTIPYNVDTVDSTSLRSSNRSPVSANETFWVPTTSQRHPSTHSDAIATTSAGMNTQFSPKFIQKMDLLCKVSFFSWTDESVPGTPTSPTGSHTSMAISISSGNTVPIARTDKHVVLAMSPARPKVSSMQAKLDHTKIDTSLYEQVKYLFYSAIKTNEFFIKRIDVNYLKYASFRMMDMELTSAINHFHYNKQIFLLSVLFCCRQKSNEIHQYQRIHEVLSI